MIVYKATNTINGKIYIGYTTKTLEKRKKEHLYKSRCKTDNQYFYLFREAIRKYGFKNFKWEIIAECKNIEECCSLEIEFIKKLNSISPVGYNLTNGGNGGSPSEQTKNKISKSVKFFWDNNKSKHPWYNISNNKRSEWARKSWKIKKENNYKPKGINHSEESKNQMSVTKNKLNSLNWINIKTGEEKFLSCTDMSKITGLSISTFNHIKNGRAKETKCGWTLKLNITNK